MARPAGCPDPDCAPCRQPPAAPYVERPREPLWLGYRETGKKRRQRRAREWASDGGGDFPEAIRARPNRPLPGAAECAR